MKFTLISEGHLLARHRLIWRISFLKLLFDMSTQWGFLTCQGNSETVIRWKINYKKRISYLNSPNLQSWGLPDIVKSFIMNHSIKRQQQSSKHYWMTTNERSRASDAGNTLLEMSYLRHLQTFFIIKEIDTPAFPSV